MSSAKIHKLMRKTRRSEGRNADFYVLDVFPSAKQPTEFFDELKDANFYTHLDLAPSFWQVRVRYEDVHKTAFPTHDGLMEWVAMPFGMCNAPYTFQRMMNDILRDLFH
jgi:hypothetical protein